MRCSEICTNHEALSGEMGKVSLESGKYTLHAHFRHGVSTSNSRWAACKP